jgi:PAS domain S-box-containing protein
VERYLGIVVDVTESKEASARRAEEARLGALEEAISNLPIGVAITELGADGEPRIVATNAAQQRIVGSGATPGAAISSLPYRAFRPDRVTPIGPRDGAGPTAARTGTPTPLSEVHLRLADGTWRVILVTAVPIARGAEAGPRRAVSLLVDVTAEREAAAGLRASEARYRGLVELSPNAVFVNRAGRLEFVNRAALALFGAERAEQLIGKSPFDLFHPDCHELMRGRLALLQSGSTAPPALEKVVRLDGATRDVEVTAAPFQDDRGTAFQVVLRDVTDELRREEALRESEQRFRALFEGASDGIVTADPSTGRVLACNSAFAAMTGYTEEEIRRLHVEDLHEPQDRPAVGVAFAAMAVGQLRVADGIPVRRKDGSVFPADITATRVTLPDSSFLAAFFRDVTERRKVAAALQASEARYRQLVEALPVGVTEADAQGQNVYSNAACQAIVGRSGEEIRGAGWHGAIHPEDRERLVSDWYAAVQTGRPYEGHYRLARPDGGVRDIHGFASTLRSPDGGVTGYLGVIRDVTSEKAARAAAEETRAMLDAALASMSDAVFITDRDGNFILFNAAFATVHRFATRDDCARTLAEYPEFLEVSFPDGTPAPLDRWAVPRALRGESAINAEYLLRRKDTGESWVGSYSFAPIRRGGAIVGSVVVGRDVTSQKRAEVSLRASEQRFRDVVASADEYIFEMNTAGEITYISEAVEGVLGYRPNEVVGQSSLAFMGPEEQERSAAYLAERAARREKISHFQQEAVHRSGRPVWLDISAVPVLDEGGQLVGYRGAALDITKRHLAEQERAALQAQLAQSQRLEGIGRLAGGVAHDFNNILSVILSCAGFALEGLKEGDPLREDILEIDKGARRAAALTRQLLAFSRKQVLQPVSLDLNQTLGEMEKMLRRIIGEDIDLVQVLAPDLGMVRADPGQIEQVIMNIAVNARDAMPEGGMLTIETANVELDDEYARRHAGTVPGPHVMLAITDSGTGMDEKTLARIFEPFFTTKGPGKGNGLGLPTVYGIVKQSGGSIHVYSEVGRGTTFKVFLPREQSLAAPLPPPVPSPATRAVRGETILVVEDDEAVRSIATRMLAGAGYQVLTAANGGEGLLTCEAHAGEIHLLLTDVVMPQMGGRVFAERLAQVRPGLKVLFMSGYTDDAIVHHGILDPGTHFVSKPFTQAELLAKVRDVLDGA